jgi:hypothetical protein
MDSDSRTSYLQGFGVGSGPVMSLPHFAAPVLTFWLLRGTQHPLSKFLSAWLSVAGVCGYRLLRIFTCLFLCLRGLGRKEAQV